MAAAMNSTGESSNDSDLHRLRGELLLQSGKMADVAEDCFYEAIAVARRQRARSLELRAAICLSRLCFDGARESDALTVLKAIYDEFTEGYETRDLKAASTLLEKRLR